MHNSKANQNTACDPSPYVVFDIDRPCTPLNRAYPRHENLDFTAPELSFDGSVVEGEVFKLTECECWTWIPGTFHTEAASSDWDFSKKYPCDIEP